MGSKVVIAASGEKKRDLIDFVPPELESISASLVMPGVLAININSTSSIEGLSEKLNQESSYLNGIMLIVICDEPEIIAESMRNFLWITFTRSNPATNIHGVGSFVKNKHWGCKGPLIIDARIKSHHAPLLIPDPKVEKHVDRLGKSGGSLHGVI
jgi:4-hydroxy-3-polyprenylbenzoate decarboxylase